MRNPQSWCGIVCCKRSSLSTFYVLLPRTAFQLSDTIKHISGWPHVGALRALIDLNGPDQPHLGSSTHGARSPISPQPGTSSPCLSYAERVSSSVSSSWMDPWNIHCGLVSSPVSCCSLLGSLALVHGLLLMDPVTSTWRCLLCPDPTGLCSSVRAQPELGLPSPRGAAGPCCSPTTECLIN